MANEDNNNKVNQTGNTIGKDNAGRDINHNIYTIFNFSSANDHVSLINFLKKELNLSSDQDIRAIIGKGTKGIYDAHRVRNSFSMVEAWKDSVFNSSLQEINDSYVNALFGNMKIDEQIHHTMALAGNLAARLEFDKAHKHFDDLLKSVKPTDNVYKIIYKEYLITGFIAYSRVNNMKGLNLLLQKKKPLHNVEEAEIIYLNIFQEICSRDTNLNSMSNAVSGLERIYKSSKGNNKIVMANSLGLAFRRLGERTGLTDLEKAINLFQEGLSLNNDNEILEVELKDQMAITHVRIFELNKDEQQLFIAEDLLNQCYKTLKGLQEKDPRNYRLLPRVLNNLGNVYKQRLLCLQDQKSAANAISCYEEAEEYWTEQESGYEWALLRKNIADTNYGLSKLLNDSSLLPDVVSDCLSAIKYRDLKNSPFQWAKTIHIIFSTVILLDTMNSIKLLPYKTRKKILWYTKTVTENDYKWKNEPMFQSFLENAKQAAIVLKK